MDPTGFRALGLRYLPWSLCSPSFTGMLAGLAPRKNFPCPRALPPPPQSSRKHALFVRSASSSDVPISDCSERNDANSCNGSPAVDEATHHKLLQIVLVSPQIPGNTGAIARTCAASAVGLHLVEPLGYTIDDAKLKRAGLDYWPYVVVKVHRSWNEFLDYFQQQDGEKRLLAFTKRAANIHSNVSYRRGDWLVFGSETTGLPPEVLLDCSREGIGGGTIRIPMVETYVRCLNLSVSVGIALYEAARQLNYEQLQYQPAAANSQNLFLTEDIYG